MSNAADLGMSESFEAAIIEHCVAAVKAGATMNAELLHTAMHTVIRRQYSLLDRPDAVNAVINAVYDNIRAQAGAPKVRTIDDAVIAAAPPEARGLLTRHRTDGK